MAIVCDKCGEEFFVESVRIDECNIVIDGHEFLLKYFLCPGCSSVYKVSMIDDEYSILLNDLLLSEKRIQKMQGKGDAKVLDKLQCMTMRKRARLHSYVDKINNKYNGTFTLVTSENNDRDMVYLPRVK